jgi:hypothetical protein
MQALQYWEDAPLIRRPIWIWADALLGSTDIAGELVGSSDIAGEQLGSSDIAGELVGSSDIA